MRCPYCNHEESRVADSRPTDEGAVIRRRRECLACGERFTTYEKVEQTPLMVVKKDGRRQPFDRDKIIAGLLTACEKRPVPVDRIQQIADDVERELRSRLDREVTSKDIGELVMEHLRDIDDIAYVRFASVYLQFADLERFRQEIDQLMQQR